MSGRAPNDIAIFLPGRAPRAPVRGLLLLLVLALASAGCLSGNEARGSLVDTANPTTPPGPGDYWMVWVHGSESHEHRPWEARVVCSVVWDHTIDREARTLERENESVPADEVHLAIVADFWQDESDCPLAYGTWFNKPEVTLRMGEHGDLALRVDDDGTVHVAGERVPPGKAYEVRYEKDPDRGAFTVENLGAWPRSGITP